MKILLLGATGLVGREVLERLLQLREVEQVVAPTRRPLQHRPKLTNPVSPGLADLLPNVATWQADAIIIATGTTMKKAGSKEAFYSVDHDLSLAFAQAAHREGCATLAFVSAMGASVNSRFFYLRLKAETERDLERISFRSLIIVRPGFISGRKGERRTGDSIATYLAGFLAPLLPTSLRLTPVDTLAESLVSAVMSPEPGSRILSGRALG